MEDLIIKSKNSYFDVNNEISDMIGECLNSFILSYSYNKAFNCLSIEDIETFNKIENYIDVIGLDMDIDTFLRLVYYNYEIIDINYLNKSYKVKYIYQDTMDMYKNILEEAIYKLTNDVVDVKLEKGKTDFISKPNAEIICKNNFWTYYVCMNVCM